jgi:ribulose-5-phosphate 4-epimerase/fuculose-1-phosphate aldolase
MTVTRNRQHRGFALNSEPVPPSDPQTDRLQRKREVGATDLATGQRIADALGLGRLVVLANHGLLTVGTTVASAIGFYLNAERAAEVCVKVPNGRIISSEAADAVHRSVGTENHGYNVFQWLVRSRVGYPTVVG